MNRLIISIAAVSITSIAFAQDKSALKDQKDKASYSIGHDIGSTFKKQNVDLNPEAILAGMKDALAGKDAMTKDERDKVLEAFTKEMTEKQATISKEAAEKNAAAGEKFLAENKKKEGVKVTASGMQYKVLKEGTGPAPKETDTVVTNYKGTLIDGTEFDSSYKRGEPASFPVNRVIKGWTEALQMMKTGSKYELYIPASLAYGERGAGREIGPNSTLIFEVELLSIKPPDAPAASAPATTTATSPAAATAVSPAAKAAPPIPAATKAPSASPAATPSAPPK